jgi:quinol monooxygenase YgiN
LTIKEVDSQIYQILGEKGNTSTFENRVRGFSDLGRFLANLKIYDLMTKEVKSYFFRFYDQWIDDERSKAMKRDKKMIAFERQMPIKRMKAIKRQIRILDRSS